VAAVRKVGIPRGWCAQFRRSGEEDGGETESDEGMENRQDPEEEMRETRMKGEKK